MKHSASNSDFQKSFGCLISDRKAANTMHPPYEYTAWFKPFRLPINPLPPLASPSGGVPANLRIGPGANDSPKLAIVALKLGIEFAATPMTKKIEITFKNTAALAIHENLCSVLICPRINPATIKMTMHTTKQMPAPPSDPCEICEMAIPFPRISTLTNSMSCRPCEKLTRCRDRVPKVRK